MNNERLNKQAKKHNELLINKKNNKLFHDPLSFHFLLFSDESQVRVPRCDSMEFDRGVDCVGSSYWTQCDLRR
jgi:hypothetical protein